VAVGVPDPRLGLLLLLKWEFFFRGSCLGPLAAASACWADLLIQLSPVMAHYLGAQSRSLRLDRRSLLFPRVIAREGERSCSVAIALGLATAVNVFATIGEIGSLVSYG
jgi:hypothetical protein